jgi:hypothetical protein
MNGLLWVAALSVMLSRFSRRGAPSGAHGTGRMCGGCAGAMAAGSRRLTAQLPYSVSFGGQSDGCVSRDVVMLPAVHYLPRSTLTDVTKHYSVHIERPS